uniref:Uncharacterized protein n=1 Tax=Fervidobacterium pennivorans TaxID=93466 RepID=A0A7V4CP26_FERPE
MSLKEKYGLTKGTRVFRPWRPEVDALIVAKDKLILIEAKLYRVYDAVAKLPIYKMLVPETPELSLWRHLPVEMQLLVVKITEPWKSIAEKVGIKLVDWAPSWVQEIFWERDLYWTREAIEMRERRKEVLKRLGFT